MSNFTEIRPVGAAIIHAGGRTERGKYMTNLIGAFHDYANAPKTVQTAQHVNAALNDKAKKIVYWLL
jgi:hypothetical protein